MRHARKPFLRQEELVLFQQPLQVELGLHQYDTVTLLWELVVWFSLP